MLMHWIGVSTRVLPQELKEYLREQHLKNKDVVVETASGKALTLSNIDGDDELGKYKEVVLQEEDRPLLVMHAGGSYT